MPPNAKEPSIACSAVQGEAKPPARAKASAGFAPDSTVCALLLTKDLPDRTQWRPHWSYWSQPGRSQDRMVGGPDEPEELGKETSATADRHTLFLPGMVAVPACCQLWGGSITRMLAPWNRGSPTRADNGPGFQARPPRSTAVGLSATDFRESKAKLHARPSQIGCSAAHDRTQAPRLPIPWMRRCARKRAPIRATRIIFSQRESPRKVLITTRPLWKT